MSLVDYLGEEALFEKILEQLHLVLEGDFLSFQSHDHVFILLDFELFEHLEPFLRSEFHIPNL